MWSFTHFAPSGHTVVVVRGTEREAIATFLFNLIKQKVNNTFFSTLSSTWVAWRDLSSETHTLGHLATSSSMPRGCIGVRRCYGGSWKVMGRSFSGWSPARPWGTAVVTFPLRHWDYQGSNQPDSLSVDSAFIRRLVPSGLLARWAPSIISQLIALV